MNRQQTKQQQLFPVEKPKAIKERRCVICGKPLAGRKDQQTENTVCRHCEADWPVNVG